MRLPSCLRRLRRCCANASFRWKHVATPVVAAVIVAWVSVGPLEGAPLTPGNLIVTVNEFTGTIGAPKYIAEYRTNGTRVQTLATVPEPGGIGLSTQQARDLIVGPDNAIYLYNGTFDPYLARLDPVTLRWTQQTFDGWSTINNISYGGIGRLGDYVFVTDMQTFGPGDKPQGVVRFDLAGGPTVRFAEEIGPIDLYVGPDGILYALGFGVHKYDPITFAPLGTVTIGGGDNRALAVAADGSIVVATWDGRIVRYSETGEVLDSLTVPNAPFSDVDIDAEGRIALGMGFNRDVVLTDLSLDSFTRFRVANGILGDVFVAWVTQPATAAIPEPSSLALLGLGTLGLLGYRWRRQTRAGHRRFTRLGTPSRLVGVQRLPGDLGS